MDNHARLEDSEQGIIHMHVRLTAALHCLARLKDDGERPRLLVAVPPNASVLLPTRASPLEPHPPLVQLGHCTTWQQGNVVHKC